jgi:hypothetical protein
LVYAPDPVDVLAPVSQVGILAEQSYAQIPVRWSGEDNPGGSGIDFFDVFVAVNDGPFVVWQARTQLRGAVFFGTFGNRYTFFSRATDRVGNQEAAPGAPDALTEVSLTNRPPVLVPMPNSTNNEGTALIAQLLATDPDAAVQTLTYELVHGPAGAQLDAATGLLVWATGEAHGDSVNLITVRVCDNGSPQLCDTNSWIAFVRDVNLAPVFVPVPPVAVNVGETLLVTNVVTDADLPVQTVTVTLEPLTTPAGMRISLTNGLWVLRWTPSSLYASTTNVVRLLAQDNGTPSMTATQQLVVLVNDFLALGAGQAVVRAGTLGSVPLTVFSSAGVVDLQWTLCHAQGWLTDLTALNRVGVTSLSPIGGGGGCYAMSWAPLNNETLLGTVNIADLSFLASSNRSAFLPLLISDMAALRRDGVPVPRVATVSGRVAIVGEEPMLEALSNATNDSRLLRLYGIPGGRYRIDMAPTFFGPWQQACEATLTNPTNLFQNVCEPISGVESNLFFRALRLFP